MAGLGSFVILAVICFGFAIAAGPVDKGKFYEIFLWLHE
jgi:hypothetical protein